MISIALASIGSPDDPDAHQHSSLAGRSHGREHSASRASRGDLTAEIGYAPRVRTLIFASCLVTLLAGCKEGPKPPVKASPQQLAAPTKQKVQAEPLPTGVRVEIGNTKGRSCQRTLCVGGPGDLYNEPNRDLGELCARAPGVVKRCEGERCDNVWAIDGWEAGLEATITSLDLNADGKLDADDPSCPLNLAGWSSGAVVVSQALPAALAADPRVDAKHAKIQNLVAITPYSPSKSLEIADSVGKAFIYRHTKSPAGDCSAAFEGGPWLSPAPACGEHTRCFDYDYSFEPELAYTGRRGARSGPEIGHCNIVALIAKIGLDNLARGQESFKQLVPPYSDGTHGGRELAPGPAKPDPIMLLPNENEPD